jgi:hypothetical protein
VDGLDYRVLTDGGCEERREVWEKTGDCAKKSLGSPKARYD